MRRLLLCFTLLCATACQVILGFEDHTLAGGTGGGGPCAAPSDCGADTLCGTRTCDGEPASCGWSFVAEGTVVGQSSCGLQTCTGASPTPNVSGQQPDGTTCDDGAASANGQCATGACVDCIDAAGCAGGSVCVASTNACCAPMSQSDACMGRECGTVPDGCGGTQDCGSCSGGDPFCDEGSGACVECLTAEDCATAPEGHACLPDKTCGCNGNAECDETTFGDTCSQMTDTCDCNNAGDCAGNQFGPVCHTAADTCGCNSGADCGASPRGTACVGSPGQCGCNTAADCLAGTCTMGVCQ